MATVSAPNSFDALLDALDLGLRLTKAVGTDASKADALIARAAGEDVDGDGAPGSDEAHDGKILAILTGLVKLVKQQGAAIQALQAKQEGGGDAPDAGAPAAGQPMTKAQAPEGLTGEQFMAKALSAQTAGRINGTQVAIAEAHINAKKVPPANIVQAVLGE